jgi:sugar phosphate permease
VSVANRTATPRRTAALVYAVAVTAYVAAVFHRSSLGVTGVDAADRFHINAAALATFSVAQLAVYAAMQVPVGVLLDRFGSRRMLLAGGTLMVAGQLVFAVATDVRLAVAARILVGLGDAMTFISVLRLGSRWFPARRGPLIAQVAALIGMAGNLISTLVLSRMLRVLGWTPAFAGSALVGVAILVLVLLFLKDHPEGYEPQPVSHHDGGYVRKQIAAAWREPGTRLGMWVHFTTQFPAMVFLLLWGMPFLVESQGLPRAVAGELLTLVVLSNMAVGLLYGQIIARHNRARLPLALGTVAATALAWGAVVTWPGGQAPMWLLIGLCTVLGACGPASMIGFDFARPANPPERVGTASGIVNMGGFTASMTTLLALGLLLDATGDNYRIAFSSIFFVEGLGLAQILRLRGRAHRRERERIVASRVETVHVPV